MSHFDEDTALIQAFIQESREHLETIEEDLIAIEKAGDRADEETINKVFRAAHSIKGSAGFLGLTKIKEIGHKAESILDLVRAKEVQPSPEVINVLLMAFDTLRELLNDYENSESADTGEILQALTDLLASFLDDDRKTALATLLQIKSPAGEAVIEIEQIVLQNATKLGQYVYVVDLDLIEHIEQKGHSPQGFISELNSGGDILGATMNIAGVGDLDDEAPGNLSLCLAYATIVGPEFVDGLFEGVPPTNIHLVQDNAGKIVAPALLAKGAHPAKPLATSPAPSAPVPPPPPPPQQPAPLAVAKPKTVDVPALPERPKPAPEDSASEPETIEGRFVAQKREAAPAREDASAAKIEDTLRVGVGILEDLMNLAGELVLGRNQLADAIQRNDFNLIRASSQRINMVTSELQEAIMQTRMQPIGNVFAKFNRVVRDLAKACGKLIEVEITGKEVEMDKAIVEAVADPLNHMIRNSVDHGIEPPDERRKLHKPEVGLVSVSAAHAAGQVIIEIADDGRGMNPDKIAASAVRKGQITQEQAEAMSDREKFALIFLPGLSTAEKVTDVSGRGVGMDVVKTNIDRLGGKIEIDSTLGKGTRFRISLPLTLAIIPSLLVEARKEKFAIPQINVQELIRIPAGEAHQRIERVGDQKTLLVRDRLIPVVYLPTALGMNSDLSEYNGNLNVVVINSANLEFGLIVEKLHDTLEIVVRPLGRHLRDCHEFAGATVLGNGEVAMILDVGGIAQKAALTSVNETAGISSRQTETETTGDGDDLMHLVIFQNAENEPCAIPLSRLQRIEQVEPAQIEQLGGRRAMKYGNRQLPLHCLSDIAKVSHLPKAEEYIAMVVSIGGREQGLLGQAPVDVVQARVTIDESHRQNGISGSVIVKDRTVLLIEVDAFGPKPEPKALPAAPARPALPQGSAAEATATDGDAQTTERAPAKPTILLAEDSAFFRQQLITFLKNDGYNVIAGSDGEEAWQLFQERAEELDLVLTDIEMPRCNGLDLTRRIRAEGSLPDLPIFAITTLADKHEVAAGIAAGVTEYHVKLDKDSLLQAIRERLLTPA